MATENFTSYTEVDPNSKITVTSSKSAFSSLNKAETAYLYDDKGAAHFDGDFTHLAECELTSTSGTAGVSSIWGIANVIGDFDAVTDSILVAVRQNGPSIFLYENDGGSQYNDSYVISLATLYYLEIERDESIGTYGTAYCRIYSDSGRTTLLDTLSITLHTSKKDYQYLYVTQSDNDAQSARSVTGYSQNLDLQEAAGGTANPNYYYAQL